MSGLGALAWRKVKNLTTTELGYLDGAVAGATVNNKAAILGSSYELDYLDLTEFYLNGTQVTASAAELNKLDGAGAAVASGTKAAHIANIATDANGTAIAAAVNGIIAVLEAFGMTATE